MKFTFLAMLAFLLTGCVTPKAVPASDVNMDTLQEMAILEDGKRGAIQRMNELSVERDALAGKINNYLALRCLCKHKHVLQ